MTSGPPSSFTTIARITPRSFALAAAHLPPGTPYHVPGRLEAAVLGGAVPAVSGRTLYRARVAVAAGGVPPGCGRAVMVPMPTIPRRVVTGHDARGRSVSTSDGPVPAAGAAPSGSLFYELWATDAAPAPIGTEPVDTDLIGTDLIDTGSADPAAGPLSVSPAPNGTKLRINELPPGAGSPMHRTQ